LDLCSIPTVISLSLFPNHPAVLFLESEAISSFYALDCCLGPTCSIRSTVQFSSVMSRWSSCSAARVALPIVDIDDRPDRIRHSWPGEFFWGDSFGNPGQEKNLLKLIPLIENHALETKQLLAPDDLKRFHSYDYIALWSYFTSTGSRYSGINKVFCRHRY
jgi:hypothetical protein